MSHFFGKENFPLALSFPPSVRSPECDGRSSIACASCRGRSVGGGDSSRIHSHAGWAAFASIEIPTSGKSVVVGGHFYWAAAGSANQLSAVREEKGGKLR